MTNNISINPENHPITEKLLNGEINLSEITLEQFREGRIIYSTMKEAQMKGFEAHHINPRSFQKNWKVKDDRCIRYTAFEHIVDHFLMAKENNIYIELFENMTYFNYQKLIDDEKELLNTCKELSELRIQGKKIRDSYCHSTPEARKNMSLGQRRRFDNETEEERLKRIETTIIVAHKSETIEKNRNSNKNNWLNKSEEEKQEWCNKVKQSHSTEEAKKNMRDAQIKYFNSLTVEEKEKIKQKRKEISNRPEMRLKNSESQKKVFEKPEKILELQIMKNNYTIAKSLGFNALYPVFQHAYSNGKFHYDNGYEKTPIIELPYHITNRTEFSTKLGKKRYNNGTIGIFCYPDEVPDGFVPGKLTKK